MHERNLFRTLIDNLPDYIFVKDAHRRFVVTNAALARHLGVGNPEELVGKTQCELSPAGLAPQNSAEDEIIRSGQPVLNRDEATLDQQGRQRWFSATKVPLFDTAQNVVGVVGISRDITERKMAEAKLRHKAFHDSLTGLPNRALFTERLERAHARKERRKSSLFGVLLLDIDRFKLVNDNLGHTVGDQFLCQVAGRLIACIRPGDTVARLGGDEFAILLEDLNGPAEAKAVAERLLEDLAVPFQLQEHKIATSASFGIALADPRRERAEELLRDADTAMYAARKLGKGRWEMFDPHMHKSTLAHLELEADLRAALERQEFLIHYQPIVDLTTGKIGGCEALLRWNHPQRDLIMPAKFLPLAEETGLIVPMGEWVLRTACAQNSAWQRAGYGPLLVSVNISPSQVAREDFGHTVVQVLKETGLEPQWLQLELTEEIFIEDPEGTSKVLSELHQLGVGIAVDDFGTGYCGMSDVDCLPLRTLKIDRSFVSSVNDELMGRAEIVKAVITMAHSLGLEVTAEGVESEEQLAFLRSQRCDWFQGFLFSRPVCSEAFTELLMEGRCLSVDQLALSPEAEVSKEESAPEARSPLCV